MFIKPLVVMFQPEEIETCKNKLLFQRGPQKITWELSAEKVLIYIFSNIIQVVGEWSEHQSPTKVTGVLNIKLSDSEMEKARFGNLTASEITALQWSDWFIYRIDKEEEQSGENTFDYQTARSSGFGAI